MGVVLAAMPQGSLWQGQGEGAWQGAKARVWQRVKLLGGRSSGVQATLLSAMGGFAVCRPSNPTLSTLTNHPQRPGTAHPPTAHPLPTHTAHPLLTCMNA